MKSDDFTVFPSWSRTSKDGILSPIFSILCYQLVVQLNEFGEL